MKKSVLITAGLCVAMILVGFVAGFYYNGSLSLQSQNAEKMNTLVIGTTKTLRLLDGAAISNDIEIVLGSQIYETVLRANPDTGVLEPLLASEMPTVSSDGLTYTIKLQQGIMMTDGVEITADVVKWSWNTSFAEPETLSLVTGYFMDPDDPGSKIDVIDKYTLQVHLKAPFAPFMQTLAIPAMCVYSPQHWDRTKDEYVGSGPWKFVHWLREEEVLLERNDNYWNKNEMPKFKYMLWKLYKAPSSLALALREGTVDIAWRQLATPDMASFIEDSNYKIVSAPATRVVGIEINCGEAFAPLNDTRVRQAISWLIDRDEIIQKAYGGIGLHELFSIAPDNLPGYNASAKAFTPPNVDKAKQLLAEAGYPDGFTTDFWISSSQYGDQISSLAVVIKDDLAKAGITLNIKDMEYAQWLTTKKGGMAPVATTHWCADYNDMYAYLFNYLSSSGDAETGEYNYYNPMADQLLAQAAQTTDTNARLALYKQIQDFAANESVVIIVGALNEDAVVRSNVQGFYMPSDYYHTKFYQVTKTAP